MESRWINYIAYGLVATLGIITMVWIVPNGRVYPYSDEWGYIISVTLQTPADFVRYLFAQHVDHRIPLQKLLHQIVLRLTEFDFRALIAMSLVFTCALAVMMMNAARLFRGRTLLGDLFIPFCALNLGSSAFIWGFGFQFVSSTFFAAAFRAESGLHSPGIQSVSKRCALRCVRETIDNQVIGQNRANAANLIAGEMSCGRLPTSPSVAPRQSI